MKIENMTSSKGNQIANQFIIKGVILEGLHPGDGGQLQGTMFQSYDSNIAFVSYGGKVFLDKKYWNYSVTTSKYRNLFLGEDKKATQKKIASGEYTLIDLN